MLYYYMCWYPILWVSSIAGLYRTLCLAVDVPHFKDVLRLPDTTGCCRSSGIPEFCVAKLCDPSKPPDEFVVFEVASRCPGHLTAISKCLADGRNHRPCCRRHSLNPTEDCLHLCDGSATSLNTSNWEDYKRYVACLTFNIKPIYQCMKEGYSKAPSAPTNLRLLHVGPTTATVHWDSPIKLSHLTTGYQVSVVEMNATSPRNGDSVPITKMISATEMTFVLADLLPDTKYKVYVESVGKDGFLSLSSNLVFIVTKGVAPTVTPHHSSETAAVGAIITLVCDVNIFGTEHIHGLEFIWHKRRPEAGNYDVIQASSTLSQLPSDSNKYNLVSYLARPDSWNFAGSVPDGRKHYITALRIHSLVPSDYGEYRCVAKNSFGENFAPIRLNRLRRGSPPDRPANLTACCQREGVHPTCLNTCRSNAAAQGSDGTSTDSSQLNFRCAMDVPIVLKCSTDGMNYDSCCLSKRVPVRCLPFCDGSLNFPLRGPLYACLLHTTNILACHLEAKTPLPYPPSNIQIVSVSASHVQLQWDPAAKASLYYVYYLPSGVEINPVTTSGRPDLGTKWLRKSTKIPQVTLRAFPRKTASLEIVIVSANEAGVSDSSKSNQVKLQ